jgi:hypothetical protein
LINPNDKPCDQSIYTEESSYYNINAEKAIQIPKYKRPWNVPSIDMNHVQQVIKEQNIALYRMQKEKDFLA